MSSHALATGFASGRYHVKALLGEGGSKRVYLAHDIRLERDVAIAVIRTEGLDEARLARVRREVQAMARLGDHPHIVSIHDVGDEGGQPYIVSQYMAGGSLDALLLRAEAHRLPITQVLRIAVEICQALEYAHAQGIIHRDLKPSNVWLTRDGAAKLGDFGLAVALDRSRLTVEGTMVGTVAYMPPEQALGRPPDARSDLYGLGATLYEMVTGRPPFLGDDVVAIVSQHINTRPVAPSWHNPDVPRELEVLILRLLAKVPEDRAESATAVRQALAGIELSAAPSLTRGDREQANPLDRLAGGVFVGREREMAALRAALDDALSGRGRLLLLVGEPGIGKTRTAEELVTYARLRNAQVLWGRCYEGDGAPVYWPWVQAIRAYVHERDPKTLLAAMGSGAADIAHVISEVRERLPGLPTPPALDPAQARFRFFDSVTTFLKNAAQTEPLVLVLDDLHWADKPSLLLLRFLARELRGARLLVVGTYRDAAIDRRHPLAETLADLSREQQTLRIPLRGLAERDVARFIEITAGVKPPGALTEAVYRETEGNPFFVNEVVRLLVSEGRLERPADTRSWSVDIPQSLREVVARRLDHLSAECNRVLTVAAVIGREFALDALERVSDLAPDPVLDVLEEAVAARVITEVGRAPGRYSFSHALIRETLYGELSTLRRVRLHRRIGEALEDLYAAKADAHLAELAFHFFEAMRGPADVEKVVAYARRAGDRATALLAHEDAASHYARALEALELKEPVDEAERGELYLLLGEAQARAGDTANGRETFLRAAKSARRAGAADRLARAALGYGRMSFGFGPFPVMDETFVSLLEEAARALATEDSPLRARILGRLAVALYWSDPGERREALSREALDMAERLGDPATRAAIRAMRHTALFGPDNVEERLALATEGLRLALEGGDQEAALEAQRWRVIALLEFGDLATIEREIEAYERRAHELRQPLHQSYSVMFRGMRALLEGRFAEGEALAREARAIGQRCQNPSVAVVLAPQLHWLCKEQGRLDELHTVMSDILDRAAPLPAARSGLAWTLCEMGFLDQARNIFEELAAHDFTDLRRDVSFLPGIATLGEVAATLGDARRAELLYRLLLPHAGRNIALGSAAFSFGPACYFLGRLATTMGRHAEAAAHFEQALRMCEATRARPFLAHTEHAYAAVLLARGERGRALQLLSLALDTARELGMKPLVERVLADKLRAQGIDSADLRTSLYAVASQVHREQPDLRSHAAPDCTVTILFTDIEGYSAMTERLGDRRAQEVLRAHNAIIRREVAAHGGFEVKSEGDGFMIAFETARPALSCATAVQRAIAAWAAEHPEAPIRVRIGLHTGEVIKEADDFFGKTVIVAARIADHAGGGEIVVSASVKALINGDGEFAFDEGRRTTLKGLAGEQQVFRVVW